MYYPLIVYDNISGSFLVGLFLNNILLFHTAAINREYCCLLHINCTFVMLVIYNSNLSKHISVSNEHICLQSLRLP